MITVVAVHVINEAFKPIASNSAACDRNFHEVFLFVEEIFVTVHVPSVGCFVFVEEIFMTVHTYHSPTIMGLSIFVQEISVTVCMYVHTIHQPMCGFPFS